MDQMEHIKQESILEFGSETTQKRYTKIASFGLWNSERILIEKYFRPKSKILDIGCGSGRTTIPLYKRGFDVIGVDITPEMINTVKKISSEKQLNIVYKLGDATQLTYPNNYFEGAIFANNGWAQIPGERNRQKALNEIFRVLKSDGYLILTAHQRYYSGSYLFFWIKQWTKFYILRPFGRKIEEIDFGDLFFDRPYSKARQFIHLTHHKEVEKQIKNAGFTLETRESMANISNEDAREMEGSL